MGIRPQFYLMCGINDLEVDEQYNIVDPRYKPPTNLPYWEFMEESPILPPALPEFGKDEDLEVTMDNFLIRASVEGREGELKSWGDLVVFNPEYGIPSAIGYIVDSGNYGSDINYALTSIFDVQSSTVIPLPVYERPSDPSTDSGRRFLRLLLKHAPRIERVEFEGKTYTHRVLPNMEFGRYANLAASKKTEPHVRYNIKDLVRHAKAAKNGQVSKVFYLQMPAYLTVAHYLLQQFGLNVRREELKLYLYLVWS